MYALCLLNTCSYQGVSQVQAHEGEPQQWFKNVLLVKCHRDKFADSGDSGSVIFDGEGDAVGLLFGCLFSNEMSTLYGLASPMEVVLKTLEQKLEEKTGSSKKDKLKLETYITKKELTRKPIN